jgi:hypothetical protein
MKKAKSISVTISEAAQKKLDSLKAGAEFGFNLSAFIDKLILEYKKN